MLKRNLKVFFYSKYLDLSNHIITNNKVFYKKKIIISGGNSPKNFYTHLHKIKIFKNSQIFLSDERLIKKMSNENFLLKIFDNINIDFFKLKINEPSNFLFAILSIAIDGHISSIFDPTIYKVLDRNKFTDKIKKNNENFERIGYSKKFISKLPTIYFFIDKNKKIDFEKLFKKRNLFLKKLLCNEGDRKIFLPNNYIKNIIFDFDGVITDTLLLKAEAFQFVYKEHSNNKQTMELIKNYHLKNGGISRIIKFKYFHKKILKKNISDKEIKYLSNKFDDYVNKKIINLKITSKFLEFLKTCKIRKINLYISSAATKKNIESFLKSKNILRFFKEIYDQRSKKIDHVRVIKRKYKANSLNTIYIGDSSSDIIAAKENNIDIFLKKHKYNSDLINENRGVIKIINNFNEIKLT